MVITKDQPHGTGRSILRFIVVKCEDHSAIQAPQSSLVLNSSYIGNFQVV